MKFLINHIRIGLLILTLSLLSACSDVEGLVKKQITSQKGVLDLRQWDFESDGPVKLDGEWEFYWDRFLYPENILQSVVPELKNFIDVPGTWRNLKIEDKRIPGDGFATFRLKVLIDNRSKTHSTQLKQTTSLALRVRFIQTAASIYVNNDLVCSIGTPGKTKATSHPEYAPQVIELPVSGDHLDIVIHVSNFYHKKGGLPSSIHLGTEKTLRKQLETSLNYDLFLFSGILIMALYHFGLYWLRRKEASSLFFGLLCLCVCLRPIFTGDQFFLRLFPGFSWEMLLKIEYLTIYSGAAFVMMFVHSLFPKEFSKSVLRLFQTLFFIFSFVVVLTPTNIFSHSLPAFQVTLMLSCAYNIYVTMKAVVNKREGSWLFFLGFTAIFVSVLNDILYNNMIIKTTHITPFGFFLFIVIQSFILSARFSKAFNDVETLSYELEKTNKQLLEVDKIKDEFLANTSHELKTPLNGIIGIAESLIDGAAGRISQVTRKNLLMIISSSKRLTNLVNDILDFSKLKTSNIELKRTQVDINLLTDFILTFSKPTIGNKPIKLSNRIDRDFPLVLADENRLQQIMHNLIGNAIKFTNSGKVIVSAKVNGQYADISVSDTGIGIPKEDRESIFLDFQQGDGSIGREYEGTGLGLSITRKLVNLHQGELTVKSEMGKGSTFTFQIPISKKQTVKKIKPQDISRIKGMEVGQILVPEENFEAKPIGEHYKILIVDDDPVNLQVLINYLSLDGYRISRADSGNEALDIIEQEKDIDLVILDVMMPRVSGFEVCKKIREKYHASELPVIFLTAKDQISNLIEGFDVGGNDYLTKPFSKYELTVRIKLHLTLSNVNKDAVTGILNRKYFDTMLDIEWRRAIRTSTPLGVIMMDIDYFKLFNDTYGHQQGDVCLRKVANAINENLKRAGDFVARYGGEEFVALLPGADTEMVLNIAKNIRACIEILDIKNKNSTLKGKITLSLGGCSFIPRKNQAKELLVERADQALYQAKQKGRNQVAIAEDIERTFT